MDDGALVEVVDGSHDAVLEFLVLPSWGRRHGARTDRLRLEYRYDTPQMAENTAAMPKTAQVPQRRIVIIGSISILPSCTSRRFSHATPMMMD